MRTGDFVLRSKKMDRYQNDKFISEKKGLSEYTWVNEIGDFLVRKCV